MIACLLPVRDGEADLEGYLESAARFADVVIALDDGSTDRTAELLEASPLIERVLHNPRRETYAGWDDAENRRRLLAAALEAGADWVIFLDADERIDPDDAQALRRFLESDDAFAGCAYGVQVFRAWGERVVPAPTHAYRVFAPAAGQTLPPERLHFNPVPTQIPREAWVRTTIRVRHLDSPERMRSRSRRYAEADPEGDFDRPTLKLLDTVPGDLVPWSPRPGGVPVLVPGEELATASPAAGAAGRRPRLACLLPVRDGEADLEGYLESAARFADVVIALDDGSTDRTAELLEASPLIERVLHNPRRETYAGWDDAENRRRLLAAALEAGADWVIFLDADERIDPDDAQALRRFLDAAPDPECAYGFRVFRMVGDEEHYDRAELWVYRLFAAGAPGAFGPARLHFVPVPDGIERIDWRKTTVRIKHLAGLTPARREARLSKYGEADPERRWQRDYSGLATAPGEPRPWPSRPADLPVIAGGPGAGSELDLEALDPEAPLISAIVIARDDAATIERSVSAVVDQDCPEPFEVIVAASGSDGTAALVRERFPAVRVVDVPEPGLPGAARNAGVAIARGEYVSFPGSHVELPSGSLAARVRAHEEGWPMVTGSIRNGNATPAGWASYFLDHSSALPGRPSGALAGAPAHCSYAREFVLEVGGFPEDMRAGEDTIVNDELWRAGLRAYRAQGLELIHHSPCTTPGALARHHHVRGRAYGQILRDRSAGRRGWRLRLVPYLARYSRQRLRDTDERVERWGSELHGEYARVRRLVVLGIVAAWAGAVREVFRPSRGGGEDEGATA